MNGQINITMYKLIRYINTGVITAKINSGMDDNIRSHRHPKSGTTIKAIATSKQAPRAQKH